MAQAPPVAAEDGTRKTVASSSAAIPDASSDVSSQLKIIFFGLPFRLLRSVPSGRSLLRSIHRSR